MSLKIAVCDDEKSQRETLCAMAEQWGRKTGLALDIRAFSCAEAFLLDPEEPVCDILLLDVEMTGMSGVELARRLRREKQRVEIVFVSSHFEYIGEGYEVDALHYLVKPVAPDKLEAVLGKAVGRLNREPASLLIACEGETIRLYEKDILYAEAFLHELCVHTPDREYRIRESISAFEGRLSEDFFRVHRSYLVNLKHITRISRSSVLIRGETELPLSRGKYDLVNQAFIRRN